MSKMLMTSKKQEESEIVVETGQSPCVQCSSGTNAIFLQNLRTKLHQRRPQTVGEIRRIWHAACCIPYTSSGGACSGGSG